MEDTSEKYNFTINVLPPEVLENIASYLDLNSIKSIHCVNKYFNHVFNHSLLWKKFLHYPEKYYVCDMQSNSDAPGIREIIEDIVEKRVGKWLGYFKLQEAHLRNWESGNNNCYHTIPLPTPLTLAEPHNVADMVDDHNEHWLFYNIYNVFHVWNITAEPKFLKTFLAPFHSPKISLLPQGKVLVNTVNLVAVYDFRNPHYDLSYQCAFYCDEKTHEICQIFDQPYPKSSSWKSFQFVVMEHMLIGYNKRFHLHVWNLKSGLKIGTIDILEYELSLGALKKYESSEDLFICHLYPGEYPNITVVLHIKHGHRGKSCMGNQVNVVNLETMKFTHSIKQAHIKVMDCCMYSNKMILNQRFFSNDLKKHIRSVTVYELNKVPPDFVASHAKHGRKIFRSFEIDSKSIVTFNQSKIIIHTGCEIQVISVETDCLQTFKFDVAPTSILAGFIQPNLLMFYELVEDIFTPMTNFRVYNTVNGKELCTWEIIPLSASLESLRKRQHPSKLPLITKEHGTNLIDQFVLRIYTF